jgi:uncharacterized membrane protein YdbT with pleckstrin-like domain
MVVGNPIDIIEEKHHMSYVESNLISGEKVLYRTGLHWVVLVAPIIVGAFFGLPGLVVLVAGVASKDGAPAAWGGLMMVLIAVACVGYAVLRKRSVEMAVTNRRAIIKGGILSRRSFEVLLSKVESIGVEEGLLGRMLGYGTVVVRGTGGSPEPFKNVAHPLEFRRQVQQQVELSQQQQQQDKPVFARV